MTTSNTLVALPSEVRETVLGAIDTVLRDARSGYAPASGQAPSNWVDFHIHAAQAARRQVAAVSDLDGVIPLELSLQEVEALNKILRRSTFVNTVERRKLAMSARRALGSGETQEEE